MDCYLTENLVQMYKSTKSIYLCIYASSIWLKGCVWRQLWLFTQNCLQLGWIFELQTHYSQRPLKLFTTMAMQELETFIHRGWHFFLVSVGLLDDQNCICQSLECLSFFYLTVLFFNCIALWFNDLHHDKKWNKVDWWILGCEKK